MAAPLAGQGQGGPSLAAVIAPIAAARIDFAQIRIALARAMLYAASFASPARSERFDASHMVRTPEALARQEQRAEKRRDQVLDAAETCFLAEGFHGASMARIAAAAKMSVGHIYQYFASKDAVIIALCERRFADFERILLAAEEEAHADAPAHIEAWIAQFAWWLDPARAPLTLEIMAEAGRNPAVAQVVAAIDHRFREIMRRSLLPLAGPIPADEVDSRLEAIVLLSHGMTSRITADASADPERLLAAFRLTVRGLLGGG